MRDKDLDLLKRETDVDFESYNCESVADLRGDTVDCVSGSTKCLNELRCSLVQVMHDQADEADTADDNRLSEEADKIFRAARSAIRVIDHRLELRGIEPGKPNAAPDPRIGRDSSDRPRYVNRRTGEPIPVYGPEERVGASLDPGSEYSDLRLGSYLRAMVDKPQNETERRALAEGTDSTGGYAVPTVLAGRMIDALSAKSVVRKAGAQIVPIEQTDELTLARMDSLPEGAWRDEGESVTGTGPSFSAVKLQPKSYAILIKASRELISDSPNLETALDRAFGQKTALVLDEAALVGGGASDPTGITNMSSINTYTHSAKMSDWDPYALAIEKVQLDNASDPDAAVMNPKIWSQHTTEMKDTTGQPLRRPSSLENLRLMQTTSMTATKIAIGDYSNLLIGIRQEGNTVEVLRERYADTLEYGFLVHMRMDVAAEHEQAFSVIDGLTT